MIHIAKNEQLLLHYLINNPEFIFKFENNYFISHIAQDIYEAIKHLTLENVSLSSDHILSESNKRNNSITKDLLAEVYKVEYEHGQFQYYYDRLKKDYAKYKLENVILKDVLVNVTSKGDLKLDKLKELAVQIDDNLKLIEGKDSILISPTQLIEKHQTVMYQRASGNYQFSFGDSYLDRYVYGGALPGQITTIFGATGMSKSSYVLNMVNKCINKQIPCIYDSLEMNDIAIMDRLVSLRNRIPMSSLCPKNGEIPEHIFNILHRERKILSEINNFYLIEEPNQKIDDIATIAKEAKRRFKSEYLIFFADLYSMFRDSGTSPQEIEDGVNRLHSLVKAQNIHFVAVVQANRELEGHKPKSLDDLNKYRLSLANIKNSGAYAERSRLVLSLFRKKYYALKFFEYDDDEDVREQVELMPDVCEVQILKQNQGNTGILKYLFEPNYFSFISDYRELKHKEDD